MDRMQEMQKRQQEFFETGITRSAGFRRAALKRLLDAVKRWEPKLLQALQEDLGKAPFEGYVAELAVVYEEIRTLRDHVSAWMRPRRVRCYKPQFPARCFVQPDPLGSVLILSPWNYPVQLTLAPLAAALAAGNCAVVKPSRFAEKTAAVLGEMLETSFPRGLVDVVPGGEGSNRELLRLKWDHIFFTGSPAVGRAVMEAAAAHLTPVTLELGGKSPCILDETADLKLAARRIAWGKLINAGQTCVAPDYVLLPQGMVHDFVREFGLAVARMYGEEPLRCPDYGKIVNEKHMERLKGLLQSGFAAVGGVYSDEERKISPTVLTDVSWDSPVMQEEIFGPILPVIPYQSFADALHQVKSRPEPLAVYLFTHDRDHERRVLEELRFGGGCVNDVVVHLTKPRMPFGGVGESGMGAYHGKAGFLTFSHLKSVMKAQTALDLPLRYPPYCGKLPFARLLLRRAKGGMCHDGYGKAAGMGGQQPPDCLFRRRGRLHGKRDSRFSQHGRALSPEIQIPAGGNAEPLDV